MAGLFHLFLSYIRILNLIDSVRFFLFINLQFSFFDCGDRMPNLGFVGTSWHQPWHPWAWTQVVHKLTRSFAAKNAGTSRLTEAVAAMAGASVAAPWELSCGSPRDP